MFCYVTGTKGGPVGKKLELSLENIFQVCVNELNIGRFKGMVHIKYPKKKGLLENSYHGLCVMDIVDTEEHGKVWWSTIDLANTKSFKEVVSTLCHEMVHVKQFLRKELSLDGMHWKGEEMENLDNPFEPPSEIEAYAREKVLFQKCVDLKLV